MIRSVVAAALAALVFVSAAHASAAERRIAVASLDGRDALALRLGAELADLGYQVVPLGNDEWRDGVTLLRALERTHSMASLTLEQKELGIEACVVQKDIGGHACTTIRSGDDAEVATRAAELVRASIVEQTVAPTARRNTQPPVTETTTAEAPPSVDDGIEHGLEARVGPGILVANGAPAELAAGVGFDWIAGPHLDVGIEAMIPITASSIDRSAGSASLRATTADLHLDGRLVAGRWVTAIGAGLGAMWLQVNGNATTPPNADVTTSASLDPFATVHAELSVFFARSLAIRTDISGGYVLSRELVRFGGTEVAEIGRPLAGSTVSLAFAWP